MGVGRDLGRDEYSGSEVAHREVGDADEEGIDASARGVGAELIQAGHEADMVRRMVKRHRAVWRDWRKQRHVVVSSPFEDGHHDLIGFQGGLNALLGARSCVIPGTVVAECDAGSLGWWCADEGVDKFRTKTVVEILSQLLASTSEIDAEATNSQDGLLISTEYDGIGTS